MTARPIAILLTIVAAAAAGLGWFRGSQPDPKSLVSEAEVHLQAGRWEEARACVRQLEGIRSPTPGDRLLRAGVESAAGDDNAALEELGNVPDDRDLGSQAHFMTGLIERRRNRLRFAEAAYRKALELDPGLIKAHKELVYILAMQSRRGELDREFKALGRITPLTHYDLYVWCLTHFVNWDPDSARNLETFVAADPDDRRSRLAMASLILGHPGEEDRVDSVLKPLPHDDPEVQALLIEKELNRGRIAEANAMIAATRADDPHLARLRGRIALSRGDRAAAVDHFRRALRNEPYDRVSTAELGKALLLQGRKDEARTYLDRAHHLDEVYNLVTRIGKPQADRQAPDLHRIAGACETAGLLDEARGWFQLAIARNPLDHEAQQGLHRLRQAAPAPQKAGQESAPRGQ